MEPTHCRECGGSLHAKGLCRKHYDRRRDRHPSTRRIPKTYKGLEQFDRRRVNQYLKGEKLEAFGATRFMLGLVYERMKTLEIAMEVSLQFRRRAARRKNLDKG